MKHLKIINKLLAIGILLFTATSCFEDADDNAIATTDVKDFVWKAMNTHYLYNDNVPELANTRFNINGIDNRYDKTEEYADYLNSFETPEDLFESLVYDPLDPFSLIVSNYFNVLNLQQGISLSNGLKFKPYFIPGSDSEVFAVITLVLNNSVASNLGMQRGQLIRAVDGTLLTVNNYVDLLSQDSYTLNFADYDNNGTPVAEDDTIELNGQSENLTKVIYTENPVHRVEILDVDNTRIGYLMYNGFNSNFENELNAAFSQFQTAGIQELVLDLRYNGGGNIQTAVNLGSMVTGQYNGQIFSKLFYNSNQQFQNRDYKFTNVLSGNVAINSLNLSRVYVLTSDRSASASELIINSLSAYIDLVHIGDATAGKTQANILKFDSRLFDSSGINMGHTYALIPLIANSTNVNDELVPINGLTPDIQLVESPSNLGVLGDISEPLLATAIADITASGRAGFIEDWSSAFTPFKTKKLDTTIEGLMFE